MKTKKYGFEIGNWVTYSKEGIKYLNPCFPKRVGTIVGFSKQIDCVRIRWDGTGTSSGDTLHKKFIKLLL